MKKCPACGNTYTDDSLMFCLSDGNALADGYEPAVTVQFPAVVKSTDANYDRVNIPINSPTMETRISSPAPVGGPAGRSGCSPMVIVAAVAFSGLLAVGGVIIGYFVYGNGQPVRNSTPSPTPTESQNINSNSKEQELKDRLEKLEKELQNRNVPVNRTPGALSNTKTTPLSTPGSVTTARVNSPGDGFLAMRSGPSHKTGHQIMKIPHGDTVSVFECQGYITIAGKTGKWCKVSYAGRNGWAFDAWLTY